MNLLHVYIIVYDQLPCITLLIISHTAHSPIHLYARIMLVRFLRLETLARKYSHLSFLFTAWGVLWEKSQTSATFQWQKFHTYDMNQCLHNYSDNHRVPNVNFFEFMFTSGLFVVMFWVILQRAAAKLNYFFFWRILLYSVNTQLTVLQKIFFL